MGYHERKDTGLHQMVVACQLATMNMCPWLYNKNVAWNDPTDVTWTVHIIEWMYTFMLKIRYWWKLNYTISDISVKARHFIISKLMFMSCV